MNLKAWVTRRIISNLLVLPAAIANYVIVYLALVVFHETSFIGLSIVLIGDIIALVLNNYLLDFNIKFAMRFKSYRDLIENANRKNHPT